MSHAYAPGPGDLLPPFAGHPHDPQCPENNSDDATAEVIDDVRYWLNLAYVAALNADLLKAREYLGEAKTMIDELLEPAS